MGRLDGKVALITGAARGQGEAEARLFVEEGARVVLGDVLDGEGRKVADSLGDAAVYLHHDVGSEESWAAAIATATGAFGKLDVLVNNAGILHVAPIAQIELDDYLRVVRVNQVGCLLGMKAAIPALAAYVASKFAILGMTRTAAIELAGAGIRVNAILPGGIDTPMGRGDMEGFEEVDTEAAYASIPLKRIGKPEEVARLALYLASDESSYCTGSQFVVDGGLTAGQSF
jgi:3alpha(or 20beta)-hydroxysteroid dehydrogenase